jgi:hypothetical protein
MSLEVSSLMQPDNLEAKKRTILCSFAALATEDKAERRSGKAKDD